jgi:hypothetical protein
MSQDNRPPLGLPDTSDIDGVNAAEVAVVRLASDRAISSREAVELTRMLDHRRRVLTDLDHARRLRAIEKANRERIARTRGAS